MPSGRPRRLFAALLGLAAFAAAVAWFGIGKRDGQPKSASAPLARQAEAAPAEAKPKPVLDAASPASPTAGEPAEAKRDQAKEGPTAGPTNLAQPAPPADPGKASGPSFDVVRVEPNGDSVIAGRGAPGATIEMLRNGKSHARAIADTSGLFAFVAPPLRPGSHEIALSSIAPDGSRAQSRESVTVVINEDRTTKPLVTLTSPDRPTVVLSEPEPSPALSAAPADSPDHSTSSSPAIVAAPPASQPPPNAGPQPPAARPGIRIASVEAEEGGRLFVSGQAAPGATVRLYLNESFIAPGGTGHDGKVSFAIGRGVRPGEYQVRLDDVDPVSGQVKSRAEVAFNVPLPLTVPLPPHIPPVLPGPDVPGTAVAGPLGPSSGTPAESSPRRPERQAAALAGPASGGEAATAYAIPGNARSMDPGTIVVPEINTAIVARGDNLWRISRRIYGQGTRYSVIYDANQAQIRSPDRIYPGQVFVLPPEQAQASPQ